MNKTQKIILGSAGAFALTLMAGTGALVAAQSNNNPTASAFLDRVAQVAGIDPQKLKDSFKQVSKEEVDKKVSDGKITKDQADNIKKKIDSGEDLGFGFGKHGMMGGPKGFFGATPDELSTFLGMTNDELHTHQRDGKTLLEIAKDKGKSEADIRNFLSLKFDEHLKNAVTQKKITQEKADAIAKDKDTIITNVLNGKGMGRGNGPRGGHMGMY